MTNPLLRAVQEYLDNESAYVRDVEGEIQRLERALDNERRQTQRRMIAALYWRAGEALRAADYCQQSYGKGSLAKTCATRALDRPLHLLSCDGATLLAHVCRAADYCQQSYGKGSLEVYMLRHNAEQIRATAATLEAAL